MVQPAPTVAIRGSCNHCGGTLILPDEDGKPYCLLCGRPYHDFRDFGRIGGLQTVLRHGREYMAEIGRRGGRPRLMQLPAPKAKSNRNGGNRLPNRLGELKELWRQHREELLATTSSSQGG